MLRDILFAYIQFQKIRRSPVFPIPLESSACATKCKGSPVTTKLF
jgi:hypothetical protein